MASRTLEQRIAALEQKLAAMESELKSREPPRDWRKTVGMFTGDEVMKEICQGALEFREADRRRAKRSSRKRRPTK